MARVRELVERWFAAHTSFDDPQWIRRFQSNDDVAHCAAFFELFCAELLAAQGYEYEREPEAPSSSGKRVEFLVRRAGMPAFYLECVTAAGTAAAPASK